MGKRTRSPSLDRKKDGSGEKAVDKEALRKAMMMGMSVPKAPAPKPAAPSAPAAKSAAAPQQQATAQAVTPIRPSGTSGDSKTPSPPPAAHHHQQHGHHHHHQHGHHHHHHQQHGHHHHQHGHHHPQHGHHQQHGYYTAQNYYGHGYGHGHHGYGYGGHQQGYHHGHGGHHGYGQGGYAQPPPPAYQSKQRPPDPAKLKREADAKKAEERNKREEEYERRIREFKESGQAWTMDDDDDEDEVVDDAGVRANAEEAEEDPFDTFLSSLEGNAAGHGDSAEAGVVGANDLVRETITKHDIEVLFAKKPSGENDPDANGAAAAAAPCEEEDKGFLEALLNVAPVGQVDDEELEAKKQEARQAHLDKAAQERAKEMERREKQLGIVDGFDSDEDAQVDLGHQKGTQEAKLRQLKKVDHSKMNYEAIRKKFYVESPAVAAMTEAEVKEARKKLDGVKVRGTDVPKPMKSWSECGLTDALSSMMVQKHFDQPFAIQAQGVPVAMGGRDMLAIAKTGSGKTLTYLLPLVRHAGDQRPWKLGEGPIAMVLLPTHELAAQVHSVARPFCEAARLRCVAAYGGINLGTNINHVRKGCEVLIGTPTRILDLLIANRGRVMNLARCSFVVVDEADRMFDEGFGYMVSQLLENMRPDRQTIMVSATMPREVKIAATKYLVDHVEVVVGGKPSPSSNVKQYIELFDADTGDEQRWLRLLQLLGEWSEKGLILIFVDNRDEVDAMALELASHQYKNVGTLHAGMDQLDREIRLQQFHKKDKNILIATGIAERGLDVEGLELVINYTLPDHIEAYVNRIGRTGRAGRKGTAYTFFVAGTKDERMAGDLAEALAASGNTVPDELQTIAQRNWEKYKNGLIARPNNTHRAFKSGKRRSQVDSMTEEKAAQMRETAKALGLDSFLDDSDGAEDSMTEDEDGDIIRRRDKGPEITLSTKPTGAVGNEVAIFSGNTAQNKLQEAIKYAGALTLRAEEIAQGIEQLYECTLEINDYPQEVRKRITNSNYRKEVDEMFDTSTVVKGVFTKALRPRKGEEKLHLLIRGTDEQRLTRAHKKIMTDIDEIEKKANTMQSAFGGRR